MSTREQRRARRKPVDAGVTAMDAITEQPLGMLGNISASGLLLVGASRPRSGAIHQVRLQLPGLGEAIELGLQEQWHDPAPGAEQYWVGYRIIAIAKHHDALFQRWLQQV